MVEEKRSPGGPRKEQSTPDKCVKVIFREEDYEQLQAMADDRGFATMSGLCRFLIKESLKRAKVNGSLMP